MNGFLTSYCFLEITSAAPMDFVGALVGKGVPALDIFPVDELRIHFKVPAKYRDYTLCKAERLGCKCRVLKVTGLIGFRSKIKNRAVLISGLILLSLLTLYIPTRVFFYSVDGLERLDVSYVLDQAEQIGLVFGTSRKAVRSEKIKNALLEAIPELKWVGINTYGCSAVISVKERSPVIDPAKNTCLVQGIFADRDGIVNSITTTKGTPLCKPGQAVSAGQLLISGYTDCGLVVRGEGAEGEVRAITSRKMNATYPIMNGQLTVKNGATQKWSIQFGKKRIKLYIDSGNLDNGCGRMIKEYKLKLPGDFYLPVSVIKDTSVGYEAAAVTPQIQEEMLANLAEKYVRSSMIAGEIRGSRVTSYADDDLIRITGIYLCDELIGKLQNEGLENLDDRTNR